MSYAWSCCIWSSSVEEQEETIICQNESVTRVRLCVNKLDISPKVRVARLEMGGLGLDSSSPMWVVGPVADIRAVGLIVILLLDHQPRGDGG